MRHLRSFTLLTITFLALACVAIQAQSPSASTSPNQLQVHPLAVPPVGCTLHCLWYSGDSDFGSVNWEGLFNGKVPNFGMGPSAQIWVPFFTAYNSNGWYNAVQISSITFNEVTSSDTPPNVTAMTFGFKSGVGEGNAGYTFASGNCTYTQPVATGRSNEGYVEYAFTCKLATPVYVYAGAVNWVNIYPTISNNDSGLFLTNAINSPEINHIGWGDVMNASYYNSAYFGYSYDITTDLYSPDTEFSVGMTGTYVHYVHPPVV